MTSQEYYSDRRNHGNYQFLALDEVVDTMFFEAQSDNDSHIRSVPRMLLLRYAKNGVRELNFGNGGRIILLELSIGDDLQFILPEDYVDYIRVSVVGKDGRLYILDINNRINIAPSYLQDHQYKLIFDSDGALIEVNGNNAFSKPYRVLEFSRYCNGSYGVNRDTTKLSRYGEFTVDKDDGVILFSSNLRGKDVVLEYKSDGLELKNVKGKDIKIHKYLRKALEDYIYKEAIARRRNVPNSEKVDARNRFKSSCHRASILLADFNPQQISRVMRGAFRPNKG